MGGRQQAALAAVCTPPPLPARNNSARTHSPTHPPARPQIGAVNTLVRQADGRSLKGYNTDWSAAIAAIERGLDPGALLYAWGPCGALLAGGELAGLTSGL